jgi:hypothetical protein
LSRRAGSVAPELHAIAEDDSHQVQFSDDVMLGVSSIPPRDRLRGILGRSEYEGQEYSGTAGPGAVGEHQRLDRRRRAKEVMTGSIDDVCEWIKKSSWYWTGKEKGRVEIYEGAAAIAEQFRTEEIDGPALMAYLEGGREALTQSFKMSIGNATKIVSALRDLKKMQLIQD